MLMLMDDAMEDKDGLDRIRFVSDDILIASAAEENGWPEPFHWLG